MMILEKLSDKELYAQCKKWGLQALEAKHKFEGLLPEVNRRRLYERRGFETIYDFARILAGLSRDQVNRVLQLERKFESMPVLQSALIEGKVSVHKLARVASIATIKNQHDIIEKVQNLSKAAIDIFVKEYKTKEPNGLFEPETAVPGHNSKAAIDIIVKEYKTKEPNGLFEPEKAVPGHNFDFEIMSVLSCELKMKIKELIDQGQDINKILLELLQNRERTIEQKMEVLSQKQAVKEAHEAPTRHIPVAINKTMKELFGTKCAEPGCGKPTVQIHHEKPFAKYRTHEPYTLKPLCKGHHELRHAGGRTNPPRKTVREIQNPRAVCSETAVQRAS